MLLPLLSEVLSTLAKFKIYLSFGMFYEDWHILSIWAFNLIDSFSEKTTAFISFLTAPIFTIILPVVLEFPSFDFTMMCEFILFFLQIQ